MTLTRFAETFGRNGPAGACPYGISHLDDVGRLVSGKSACHRTQSLRSRKGADRP